MNFKASRNATQALSSTFTVALGRPITVFGFIIANSGTTDVEVTWTNNAGTTIGFTDVGVHDTFESNRQWIADAGLKFPSISNADVHVTVFYSHSGT